MANPTFTPKPTRLHADFSNVFVERSWQTAEYYMLEQVTDVSSDIDDGGDDWRTFGSGKQVDTIAYNRNVTLTLLGTPAIDEEAMLLNMKRPTEDLTGVTPTPPTWVSAGKYGVRYMIDPLDSITIQRYTSTLVEKNKEVWTGVKWNSIQRSQDANGNETLVFTGIAETVSFIPAAGA